ncbi:MAG: arsenate reductase [Acidobacteria bacterium]|nr:arsenate reductase [Acidobacteriota bacterium]
MASVTMFGIRNCDTIKRARAWLDAHGVDYAFHDYKTAGVNRAQLEQWCRTHGWEAVLNRAGTTFRKLPEAEKTGLNETKAIALMLAHPSAIKRPILDIGGDTEVGFSPDAYTVRFGSK